ncbi:hypothetical protein VPH35_065840 [Triticum aestivum]
MALMQRGGVTYMRTCQRQAGRIVAPPHRRLLCTMRCHLCLHPPPGKELEVNRRWEGERKQELISPPMAASCIWRTTRACWRRLERCRSDIEDHVPHIQK